MFRAHRSFAALLICSLLLATAPVFAAETGKVVNINTATAAQLAHLPRVGPALAKRIVEFREQNGAFKKAEDLIQVRGIGEKSFAFLKPYVTTSGETTLTAKLRSSRPAPEPASH